jgi:hypothetical protein
VEIVRNLFMRIEVYSRYNMHLIGSGNGFDNFNSILMLPFPGIDVCPEAARSGDKSKRSMK